MVFFTLGLVLAFPTTMTCAGDELAMDTNTPALRTNHVPLMSYIEDRDVRLGIDLHLGGAITYLAPATNRELNLINSSDWGRQVQLSYYSGPVPYNPSGTTMNKSWHFIGWNPIQSGDCYGYESKVLKNINTGKRLYTKLIPMHWPLKDVPGECECEVWLELDGPVVKARCRLTNKRPDHTQYPARTQELPAVYVNAPFYHLVTYRGDNPFTGDALAYITNRLDLEKRWTHWMATENWAAQVNDAGWGVGVWNPDALDFSGGFYKLPGVGGPRDTPTGYIAPNRLDILDYNIVYDYHYELILGTVAQIRAEAYRRAEHPRSLAYRFEKDRQGWYYKDATDTGWPIRGELNVNLDGPHPEIFSPVFLKRAEAGCNLTIEAAFPEGCTNATILWRRFGDRDFTDRNRLGFAVVPDGQLHPYGINLGVSPEYAGLITQLRLDVSPDNDSARLRMKSVTFGADKTRRKAEVIHNYRWSWEMNGAERVTAN